LRDRLNKILNKRDNKTSTFQLIGEATKYNFENLKKLTSDLIVYYNSEKPHQHLNELPPDTWADKARVNPEQTYIFKKKEVVSSDTSDEVLKLPEEVLMNFI
jgi:hypothetical protein